MNAHQLHLKSVRIALQERQLLEIDAVIEAGEVLTVMGPSGAGKSSLLAYVAGFLAPAFTASGDILLDTELLNGLAAEHRRVGLLFQDPMLFPHLSVAGNLRFAIPADAQDKEAIVSQALASIGLQGFAKRDPDTLSGGQKSRVALQRLLLSQPKAVLLDEPFSRLDAHLRREVREFVFKRLREAGLPAIMVTHDREDAEAANGVVIAL